jgi:bifunctional non-homologous end joining protein LigD
VPVEVEGRTLDLTNLDKVLYPGAGFTKAEVVDYYRRIAPVLLPHLKDRPLTLKRYPDGVEAESFFEKNAPSHRPGWVKTADVWSEGNDRWMKFVLCNDVPTLVWVANLAALELHPQLHKARKQQQPTLLAFDLDPGAPAALLECCQVGVWVRDLFRTWGLQSFPKTSGGKGLQVYVPLNTPTGYEQTKGFARAVAEALEKRHPGKVVSKMQKSLRTGKVFVDWSQNDEHKTTVSVYSLRARERPWCSTPLAWREVEQALDDEDAGPLRHDARALLPRVAEQGDLFAPVQTLKQKLPDLGQAS